MSDDRATTGHRSHRYLRLSLAVTVLALFVGVGVQIARSGVWLPSISHYVYTPAGGIFAASLVAASLALVVLAGRDLETIFLDVAAVFAPIIALVPTGISAELLRRVSGLEDVASGPCSPDEDCIPARSMDAVYTGVITYAVVVGCVVVLSIWVRRDTLRMLWRTRADAAVAGRAWALWSTFTAPVVAVVVVVVLMLAAFVDPVSAGFPFNPWIGISVHLAATILFFAVRRGLRARAAAHGDRPRGAGGDREGGCAGHRGARVRGGGARPVRGVLDRADDPVVARGQPAAPGAAAVSPASVSRPRRDVR